MADDRGAIAHLLRRAGFGPFPGQVEALDPGGLDRDGNLVSPVGIGQYYAVLASFLGVHPSDVLPGNTTSKFLR